MIVKWFDRYVVDHEIEDKHLVPNRSLGLKSKIENEIVYVNFSRTVFYKYGYPNVNMIVKDKFDRYFWTRLGSNVSSFNIIVNNAMHASPAIDSEWKAIAESNLLDKSKFLVIWTNCGSVMRRHTFYTFLNQTTDYVKDHIVCSSILKLDTKSHPICIMTTLNLTEVSELNTLTVIKPIVCTDINSRISPEPYHLESSELCIKWARDYNVLPLMSWGTLPVAYYSKWTEYSCDNIVQNYEKNHFSLKKNDSNLGRNQHKHAFDEANKCLKHSFDPKYNLVAKSNQLIPVGRWFANPALSLDESGGNQIVLFKYHIWPFAYLEQSVSSEPFRSTNVQVLTVLNRDRDSKISLEGGPIDARLLNLKGRLFVFFSAKCSFMWLCMSYVEILRDRKNGSLYTPHIGTQIRAKEGLLRHHSREKNWSPFNYKGRILLIYSIIPHRILAMDYGNLESDEFVFNKHIPTSGHVEPFFNATSRVETVDTKLVAISSIAMNSWKELYGELRGGSQAVLLNKTHYITAFHSSHKNCDGGAYFMGFYLFRSEPPFEIVAISPDPVRPVGFYDKEVRGVYFVSGIILIDDRILRVSYGRDDREGYLLDFEVRSVLDSLENSVSVSWGTNSSDSWDKN